jgi:hypothetical protein
LYELVPALNQSYGDHMPTRAVRIANCAFRGAVAHVGAIFFVLAKSAANPISPAETQRKLPELSAIFAGLGFIPLMKLVQNGPGAGRRGVSGFAAALQNHQAYMFGRADKQRDHREGDAVKARHALPGALARVKGLRLPEYMIGASFLHE